MPFFVEIVTEETHEGLRKSFEPTGGGPHTCQGDLKPLQRRHLYAVEVWPYLVAAEVLSRPVADDRWINLGVDDKRPDRILKPV